jgi:SpoVK/Ycf46/Vps4 family AAA+-type ATPase
MRKYLKPGYRSLFFGPPGTGKTLSAALLGKVTGYDVFRIDLSMMVSKFIGETEKNLAQIFDRGLERNWILFFDEADALFGKRTQTTSSHDRYANQEVSYLLQRIEDYPGMVILATNFKHNIDSAFMRRFQSVVQFVKPDPKQRQMLWQLALTPQIPIEGPLNLEGLAEQYELTGGEIVNAIRHAALLAVEADPAVLTLDHLLAGIKRELTKDGRMFEMWKGQ